ncbi:GAF domain-containing sensor histidine kinase [Bdellovibrio bacteriovorus]|uniref:GAF domain-containing sensor histidine kinase n=1 Tax=Bdellovibrio bacteriovorus TaxID=959 RepID=UPI0021D08062|nr:GAF domain-containing sensor histidine kinase [Bdellovibrio bacteriovorus]UXR63415.1 GAF domain-containing sensor histidine kinase [Bdellovibrio bacteriovorus]
MEVSTMQSLELIKDIYNVDQLLSGKSYIQELVHRLAKALNVKYVMVGHAIEPEQKSIQTDFLWAGDGFVPNVVYELADTPCTHVICGTRVNCYNSQVQLAFPKDRMLQDMNIESYIGAPFLHTDGGLIGLLVIMDEHPFKNPAMLSSVVEFFAARIGTEYRRLAAEDSLLRIKESLEQLVQERTAELQQAFASLQQTQKQLISQEKLATIGRITFGIAHELKNPLNIIINASEILQTEDLDPDSFKKAADMIQQHSLRANDIITNMLKQARQESSQQPEWINLSAMLDRSLDMYLRSLTDTELRSRLRKNIAISPGIKACLLDAPGIERVFINIVDNSLYALAAKMHQGENSYTPEINVTLNQESGFCRITVRDNGIGIALKHLPNVCDEFYTTKPAGEGTGLGLWIAKQNVEKNRGSFSITSEEDVFTEVIIELPNPTELEVQA